MRDGTTGVLSIGVFSGMGNGQGTRGEGLGFWTVG